MVVEHQNLDKVLFNICIVLTNYLINNFITKIRHNNDFLSKMYLTNCVKSLLASVYLHTIVKIILKWPQKNLNITYVLFELYLKISHSFVNYKKKLQNSKSIFKNLSNLISNNIIQFSILFWRDLNLFLTERNFNFY